MSPAETVQPSCTVATYRPVRLLVADDSPAARQQTLDYLTTLGDVRVEAVCDNGRSAVEIALRSEPDVVLLDLQMPEMSGLEAAEIFSNSMPHVGVIITSMQDRLPVREACLVGGADAFISKRTLPSDFPAVLAAVVKARRAPERHRRASPFVTRPLTDLFAPPRPLRPARAHTPAGTPGRRLAASGIGHD